MRATVDLGGHHVCAEIVNGADPAVVFVSQMSAAGSSWKPVTELLDTNPTVVTYDRPGIGDSPPRPAPNPPLPYGAFADELAAMLDRLRLPRPVIAVGHSAGSLIVRAFAVRHPSRVAGMVHVDGSLPRLALWPSPEPRTDGEGPNATAFDAVAGEAEILGAALPLVPGVVIVRTPGRWDVALPHPALADLWQANHRDLARQTGAPLVVAADAGHQIPQEAPQLIAFAVDEVVQAVRRGDPTCRLDPDCLARVGGLLSSGYRRRVATAVPGCGWSRT
jgi:pimeloyl-ACP methyl ester carboxylesterase